MKFAVIFVLLTFAVTTADAGDSEIAFRKGSYAEVMKQAKTEGKPIFLYFHFDGCGACSKMEKTAFVDPGVADYYNSTFVCFEVNTKKGEGVETNKIYNVQMHPSFIYLDSYGTYLHTAVGVFSPEEFISQGRVALDPDKRLSTFTKRYEGGERDPGFLYEYCYKLRDSYALTDKHIRAYISTQSVEELKEEKNIRFIYEFAIHGFEITMPLGSTAYQSMLDNREMYARYFDAEQVHSRLVWIAHSATRLAIEMGNDALFEKAIAVLKDFDNGKRHEFKEMDGRLTGVINRRNLVLSAKMDYYAKRGDTARFEETAGLYIEKVWGDSDELNDLAWKYYEQYDDARHLETALAWAERSLELRRYYANVDTHAALLYKLGRYDEALTEAEAAVELAKQNEYDYEGTTELIEKIRVATR